MLNSQKEHPISCPHMHVVVRILLENCSVQLKESTLHGNLFCGYNANTYIGMFPSCNVTHVQLHISLWKENISNAAWLHHKEVILHLNLYFSSEHFSRYRINWNVFKCMKNGCIFIQILLVCFWQEIDLIDNKSAIMKVNHIGLFHDKQFICSTYPSFILLTESNQANLVNLPKLQDGMLTGMFL